MKKKLVIVESPAKARTINRLLGDEYEVRASVGHIRDLPEHDFGVDIEGGFEPRYVILPKRRRTLMMLRKSTEDAENIYLATDMDREGEAIAWHLKEALRLPDGRTYRVVFNEITPKAIEEAFANPGKISMEKVNAQQARRILDRIIGYRISPLLCNWFVRKDLSAGRVQSVALRLIVEREKEIEEFKPRKFWTVSVIVKTRDGTEFSMKLMKVSDRDAEFDEEEAEGLASSLKGSGLTVLSYERKKRLVYPSPPHITSTLQQEMSAVHRMSPYQTMRNAQALYEGVDLGEGRRKGLITYHRTDSVRVSQMALGAVRRFIREEFDAEYLPIKANFFRVRSGAQAAHEAIRPTDVRLKPEKVGDFLEKGQRILYEVVWRRFVASQMAPASYQEDIAEAKFGDMLLSARRRVLSFDGYLKIYGRKLPCDESLLPELKPGDRLTVVGCSVEERETEPPSRYTESSLIRKLEREGIGRPSTYATIVHTLYKRRYVIKRGGVLYPTDLGRNVTEHLVRAFPKVMDVSFTSDIEEQLDLIEENKKEWRSLLDEFYATFEKELEEAGRMGVQNDRRRCPKCGSVLVVKYKKGEAFYACPRYGEKDEEGRPRCSHTEPTEGRRERKPVEETDMVCEKCGAKMVIREGRYGRFIACSAFPKCKNTKNYSILKMGASARTKRRRKKR